MATEYFDMTPGSGASMATREVGGVHYQRVTGDIYYHDGVDYLGGGNGSTAIGGSPAMGTLLCDVADLPNAGLEAGEPGAGRKDDSGLIEIIDIDVVSPVQLFKRGDRQSCRLGVMLLNGDLDTTQTGNTLTPRSPIAVRPQDREKILTMLTLNPVEESNGLGNLYNYTFHTDTGRHRTFIHLSGTRSLKMAFYLREASDTTFTAGFSTDRVANAGTHMLMDAAAANANPMAWRVTFDRTMT